MRQEGWPLFTGCEKVERISSKGTKERGRKREKEKEKIRWFGNGNHQGLKLDIFINCLFNAFSYLQHYYTRVIFKIGDFENQLVKQPKLQIKVLPGPDHPH